VTTASARSTLSDSSVTIRPITAADGQLEKDFIRALSAQTKFYRFLCGVNELSPAELKRLCSVDGNHSMAFVATVNVNGRETEIGVCRYAESTKADVREIGITIADAWAHKGLAELLLKHLIDYAKSHGVKRLYSVDMADNTAMRDVAAEFGMSKRANPEDASQVIYSLAL
jgi:RimJ/RimL family protein N-acetyltransferase